MKLPNSNISTSTSGLFSSSDFGIGDAGIILEILRTKIYSNPILAVCREITCNARDAHREVGTPNRPIEIQLPGHWSNNLIIKDFGPGIDPSRMENIFIKFGNSTKRNDNIQLGGYGLGCKSPLAYSDTFNVITIVDSVKYTYSAYIDETKAGKMVLLSKEDTTEPNGTSIEIPILSADYRKFADTIVGVTQHWDVKPILSGGIEAPSWKTYTYVYQGINWLLPQVKHNKYSSYYDATPSLAIIDGIGYEVKVASIANATELQKSILKTGFHLIFGIGELSLAASRDSLHYDEVTQQLILDRVDSLAKDILYIINDEIKNAPTYVEASIAYAKVKEILNYSGLLDELTGIQWQGHKIRLTIRISDIGDWARVRTYLHNGGNIKTSYKDLNLHFRKSNLYHCDLKTKSVPGYVIRHIFDTTQASSIQVLWAENEPSGSDFVREAQRAANCNQPKPVVTYNTELLQLIGAQSLQSVMDSIPKDSVAKARKPRVKTEKGKIIGYKLIYGNNTIGATSTLLDIDHDGVYVEFDYKTKEIKSDNKILTLHQFTMLAGLAPTPIWGFSECRLKKIRSLSNWVPLVHVAQNKIVEVQQNVTIADLEEAVCASHYLFKYHLPKLLFLTNHHENLAANSIMLKYIDESKKVVTLLNKYINLFPILRFFGHAVGDMCSSEWGVNKQIAPQCKLAKLNKEVYDRYPLLRYCGANFNSSQYEIVTDYINLIDAKLKRDKQIINATSTLSVETTIN